MLDWSAPVEVGSHLIEVRDRGPGWGVADLLLDGEVVFRASSRTEACARGELLARALGPGPVRPARRKGAAGR
jgi:hypothetical protein